MTALTPDQLLKVKQDNIKTYLEGQLNPASGSTVISKKKADAMAAAEKDLANNPDKDALLKKASENFDKQLIASAQAGAAGGNAEVYKATDPAQKKAAGGFADYIDDMLNSGIGRFFGGLGNVIWKFLKIIPGMDKMLSGIGDWVSEQVSGNTTSPEQKQKDSVAAGVASKLSQSIDIEGTSVTVNFTAEEQARMFRDMSKHDFAKPSAAPVVPSDTAVKEAAVKAAAGTPGAGTGANAGSNGVPPTGAPPPTPAPAPSTPMMAYGE